MRNAKIASLSFVLVMSFVSVVTAGTWTFTSSFDPAVDLKNDGTLIKATNFGNSPAATATVNGVVFDVDWSNTNVDMASLGNSTTAYYSGTDTDIAKLMNQSAQNYTWGWSGPRQLDITLGDLEIGSTYRIQILTAGVGWHGNDFFVNDWSDYEWVYMNEGDLLLATYTWTATSASIMVSNNVNWSTGDGAVDVMGYAVHEIVPEPTTMVLMGFGILAVLKNRKK
jgi:hypothetical protein